MKKILSLVLFVSIQMQIALACTFIPDSFCVTASVQPDDLVVSGMVTSIDSDGINLEIIEVISGVETRENIRIWDGTDFDCNGIFSMAGGDFTSLNQVVIIIIPEIVEVENTWDVIGDYRWPDIYSTSTLLTVEGNTVNGFISGLPFPPEAGLHEFDFDLFTQYWLEDSGCDNITDTEDILHDLEVTFYPNPVREQINIQMEDNFGSFELEIVDIFGKIIKVENCSADFSNISLSHLAQGTYLARIRKEDAIVFVKKLVKV